MCMDEELNESDLRYLDNPFTKSDLKYLKKINAKWIKKKKV